MPVAGKAHGNAATICRQRERVATATLASHAAENALQVRHVLEVMGKVGALLSF